MVAFTIALDPFIEPALDLLSELQIVSALSPFIKCSRARIRYFAISFSLKILF
jgi:hypothetical protein